MALWRACRPAVHQLAQHGLKLLQEMGVKHRTLDAAACLPLEPGLNLQTRLQAGIHLRQDGVGICRQFAQLMKAHATRHGAEFCFDTTVRRIVAGATPVVEQADGVQRSFDAVVVCAGVQANALLQPLGLRLPLAAVHGYSVTAPLRHIDGQAQPGPRAALMDERYKVDISRLGLRVRVSGSAQFGGRLDRLADAPLRTLYKVLDDWFPGAAMVREAQQWRVRGRCSQTVHQCSAPVARPASGSTWATAPAVGRWPADRPACWPNNWLAASPIGRDPARRGAPALTAPSQVRQVQNAAMTTSAGPLRINLGGPARPLHGAAATRLVETQALASHPAGTLMARAGLAVAQVAMAMAPHARVVHVLAGPGNNGGDGLVAARHLHEAGKQVLVTMLGDPAQLPNDAAVAYRDAAAAGVPLHRWSGPETALASRCELVIDALLGLGAARALTGVMADAVTAINQCDAPVLAVDIPSGLNPDTGAALGGPIVWAHITLSLLTLKPGCFTAEGRDHAGQVWLDCLGVAADGATAVLTGTPGTASRLHASHKGNHGDLAVVGGARGMVGAAWLAARAALAAGAGRVFVNLLDEQAAAVDLQRPELMSRPGWWRSVPEVLRQTTVVCGCGAGESVVDALPPLLAHAARLVLDADALNAIAGDATLLTALRARAARGRDTVLTPHPLEAARLLGCSASQVQHDRIGAATSLAECCNATVVLKGSGSIVATMGALPCINPTGNDALATAGTGDVLAGWIGGLWARAGAPGAHAVAATAVYQHGCAADRFVAGGGTGPLRAADLVEWLAGSWRRGG